jgi:hypothetical protein
MVMTLLSHFMTFPILSPHKFADVAGNLILMTLTTETGLSSPKNLVNIFFCMQFFNTN